MSEQKVRICDIAEELGLSTATVSNVIHGKTKKISDETVKRVQELLEKRNYIPNMAALLLAQNNAPIIGIVINHHEKYGRHVLEDAFIASAINYLSEELENAGYFMMLKVTDQWNEIPRFASMWNMEGLVIIGFCESDYTQIRNQMHIPFVIYDGYLKEDHRICNITIDNFEGGKIVGEYLLKSGHQKVLCISDNDTFMDQERYMGLCSGMAEYGADRMIVPMDKQKRKEFYHYNFSLIKDYSAVFAVSDFYAIEMMQFLQEQGIRIPQDISVVGFDNSFLCENCYPTLTSVKQDNKKRAELAIELLKQMKNGEISQNTWKLPVQLMKRKSSK